MAATLGKKRGLLNQYDAGGLGEMTPQDAWALAKGIPVGLLAMSPDAVGMATEGVNAGLRQPRMQGQLVDRPERTGDPYQFPVISGDPIREVAGTNNVAGLLGEFIEPSTWATKGMGLSVILLNALLILSMPWARKVLQDRAC